MDLLHEAPGRPLGELKEALGVGWGTLYYHVNLLERAGLVRTVVSGRRKLVFPGVGERDPREVAGRSLLVGPTARRVARAIVERPGRSLAEVGAAAGENPRVAYYHVRRFVEAGLVSSSSRTRYAGLAPTRLLERVLRDLERQDAVERSWQSA